ncbi:MAG: hypothetical protein AAFN63_11355 [Pseudomonadota bacterium]
MSFEIERHRYANGHLGYKVVDAKGAMIGRPKGSLELAETFRDEQMRKLKDADGDLRACITCTTPFVSEGIHNRMCNTCRARANDAGMI